MRDAWIASLICALAVFAAVPDFAWPWHRCGRRGANESAAIATLNNLHTAQEQWRRSGVIDQDGDGEGEYGYLRELAGDAPSLDVIAPLMSPAFRVVSDGCVRRSGYVFQIFLPGAENAWLPEAPTGGRVVGTVDADRAERAWLAYAWPQEQANAPEKAQRTFVVFADGLVLATDGRQVPYGGDASPARGLAAHRFDGARWRRCVGQADDAGNVWIRVH